MASTFKPVCPECQYDLVGLADGQCPECGSVFSHASLRQMFDDRRQPSDACNLFGTAALCHAIVWLFWGQLSSKDYFLGISLFCGVIFGVCSALTVRQPTLCQWKWLVVPGAALAVIIADNTGNAPGIVGLGARFAVAVVVFIAICKAFIADRMQVVVWAVSLCTTASLILTCFLAFEYLPKWTRGAHWTDFDKLVPDPRNPLHPMTVSELQPIVAVATALSIVLIIAWVAVARRCGFRFRHVFERPVSELGAATTTPTD